MVRLGPPRWPRAGRGAAGRRASGSRAQRHPVRHVRPPPTGLLDTRTVTPSLTPVVMRQPARQVLPVELTVLLPPPPPPLPARPAPPRRGRRRRWALASSQRSQPCPCPAAPSSQVQQRRECPLGAMDAMGALGAVSASLWVQGAAVAALFGLVYYYLLMPVDWTKDLCDVGFEPTGRGWRKGFRTRAAVMREAQRRRRLGNLPPVYPNGWFAVLESSSLPRSGVEHVTVLGQNLAVFRGETGTVHILDAYCPHLGGNMAEGGVVHGDCLRCPFHDWSFNGHDGKCASVPYAQKVPDFARVKHWESFETNGFVFVWHHAEGEPPSWWPQPVPSVMDAGWAFVGRNEFTVSCHIQEIPENGADVAHLNAVHGPGMMGLSALSQHLWSAQWNPGTEPDNQHTAELYLDHEMEFFGKLRLLKISVRANQIGPGYVEFAMDTTFGPIVMLQSVTPVEPLVQKVVHRMHCPRYLVPYAKFVLYGECVMFERDVLVWNHKKFEDKPLLVKEDRQIARYRRWYSQFYSENSPKHSFQRETMEW